MVKRLADKPFTLLGINSDQSRSALKKIMDEQNLTWPQMFDGMPGPIAKRWNIHSWPTIYILDQEGVIRYRDVRDEALEKAVNTLLGIPADKDKAAASKPSEPEAPARGR